MVGERTAETAWQPPASGYQVEIEDKFLRAKGER